MIFNERLKILRLEKSLTQEEAAGTLKFNYRHYQRLEADGHLPNYKSLLQIADFYDVSVDWLMGRTEKREVDR